MLHPQVYSLSWIQSKSKSSIKVSDVLRISWLSYEHLHFDYYQSAGLLQVYKLITQRWDKVNSRCFWLVRRSRCSYCFGSCIGWLWRYAPCLPESGQPFDDNQLFYRLLQLARHYSSSASHLTTQSKWVYLPLSISPQIEFSPMRAQACTAQWIRNQRVYPFSKVIKSTLV